MQHSMYDKVWQQTVETMVFGAQLNKFILLEFNFASEILYWLEVIQCLCCSLYGHN